VAAERIALAGLLGSLCAWGFYLLRRRSPLHLTTLALFATGLIGSFFPIASLAVRPASWRNLDALTDEVVVAAQVEYAAFAAGLVVSVLLAAQLGWLLRRDPRPPARDAAARDLLLAAGLVGCGLTLYAAYVQRVGLAALADRHDYAHKYLVSQGLGPLQFGLTMAIVGCLWAEASALSRAHKNLFLAVAAGIAAWTLALVSIRTNLAILVLGYLVILCERRRIELRRVRPALVVAGLVFYVVLEGFALFRGVYRGNLEQALDLLAGYGDRAAARVVGGSELAHPFVTAGEVLRSREPGELAGRSLVDGVVATLPRSLHPDRPAMLSEQFVRSNYSELAARGGGAAFSLVAEAWLDFGSIVGPALFGAVLGLLLSWAEQRRARAPDGLVARLVPYVAFYVAMEHRNEFGTIFKHVVPMAVVVVPFWIAAETAAASLGRRAPALLRR
jgi:hypothetical protein